MTDAPEKAPDALRDRFAQAPLDRPLAHQLTLPELADALHKIRTINDAHAALCSEAAHRLLVVHQGNTQLANENDRLRHHQRLANARIDDMRNNIVSLNTRIDDMRRATFALEPQPAVPGDLRSPRLQPDLDRRITEAIGQASMCWANPAGAGTFNSSEAQRIARALCAAVATEIDAARLRRRAGDDQVDWRRRALEAEQRADSMQFGMMNAQLDRMHHQARDGADEGDLPTARQFFNAITTRMRRAFWRKKDTQ